MKGKSMLMNIKLQECVFSYCYVVKLLHCYIVETMATMATREGQKQVLEFLLTMQDGSLLLTEQIKKRRHFGYTVNTGKQRVLRGLRNF